MQLFPDVFHPWVVEATGVSGCRLRTWKEIQWGASPERFPETLPRSRSGSRWRNCRHVPEHFSVPWLPPLHYSLFDSNLPFAGSETVLISITKEVLITEATADKAGLQWGKGLSVIHRVSAALHDASQLGPDPFFICLKPFPLRIFYYFSLLLHWRSELILQFTGKKNYIVAKSQLSCVFLWASIPLGSPASVPGLAFTPHTVKSDALSLLFLSVLLSLFEWVCVWLVCVYMCACVCVYVCARVCTRAEVWGQPWFLLLWHSPPCFIWGRVPCRPDTNQVDYSGWPSSHRDLSVSSSWDYGVGLWCGPPTRLIPQLLVYQDSGYELRYLCLKSECLIHGGPSPISVSFLLNVVHKHPFVS